MKNSITLSAFGFAAILLSSCASNEKFEVGGVPAWVAGGAKLDTEPEPYRPDPAIAVHEDESGPVNFTLITDKHKYPDAPSKAKKKSASSTRDPLERGRDYRIRRLVR